MSGTAKNGFTLIELLVSLGVMAMTATLLVAGLSTGRGLWQRSESAAVSGESVTVASRLLRDRIQNMLPETRFDGETPYVDFRGEPARVDFSALPAAALRPSGLQRYRLSLTPQGVVTVYAANLQNPRIDVNSASVAGWQATPLIGGVRRLALSYYGAPSGRAARSWQGQWLNRAGPPELVRVRIEFAAKDPRHWPDLVIRPVATVATGCRFDAALGRCEGEV
jgi:general secretion pathway protein J